MIMNMINSPAHHHRPFPNSSSSTSKNEKDGRTLLDLLRSREKIIAGKVDTADGVDDKQQRHGDDDEGDHQKKEALRLEHEIISRLHSLNASIRRCGLFANDVDRAQSYYNHASTRSSSTSAAAAYDRKAESGSEGVGGGGGGGSSAKKRKRKKGGAGGGGGSAGAGTGPSTASYGIHLESHSNASSFSGISGEKCDLDEGLVLTAICRILGVAVGRKKKEENDASNPRSGTSYGLMCASLNVLSSLCDHAKDGMVRCLVGASTCASVEGDMVGSIGSPLLDALRDNILYLYCKKYHDDDKILNGLAGCFKACASVLSLLEMRLSRADKTIQSLRETTWLVVNNLAFFGRHEGVIGVQRSATALLATLALAGSSPGGYNATIPPSKLWSRSVADGIALLHRAVHDFFPMPTVDVGPSSSKDNSTSNSCTMLEDEAQQYPKEHENWLSIAKEAPSVDNEEINLGNDPTDLHRSKALQSRIQCLTSYIHSLLSMENYPLHRSSTLFLPLDSLLDTAEVLLSFTLAAEATHRSTKSRLRACPVKDGLISPNAAVEIGPDVRSCGHALLDVAVDTCRGGGAPLLGRARRLVGMAVANLTCSCSSALVSAASDGGRGSGGGSWLRGSIPLRTRSVRTFRSIAVSLGSGAMSSTGTCKSMCRGLVLLGGCLLEQVTVATGERGGRDDGTCGDDEWGTLGEIAKLVETSSSALASCIAAFGGLIPNNVRATLDSITHSCLSTLYSHGVSSSIFVYSHVKRSILQLGMNCICIPYGDGGCTTITGIVRKVSTMLSNDVDVSVASAALSTLCALDALTTPRAPPLLIPTRAGSANEGTTANYGGSDGVLTASALLQGISKSKAEMAVSKKETKKEQRSRADRKKAADGKPKSIKRAETNNEDKKTTKTETKAPNADGSYGAAEEESTPEKEIIAAGKKNDNGNVPGVSNPDGNIINCSKNKAEESIESTANKTDNFCKSNDSGERMVAELTTTTQNSAMVIGHGGNGDEEDMKMKEENDNSDDDDINSLGDFPDIIDEDPDEEDRI